MMNGGNMVYFITGDTHGLTERRMEVLTHRLYNEYIPKENAALIILGDSGFNYWGDSRDTKLKKRVNNFDIPVYCLHGNHEEDPRNVPNMSKWWDEEVNNFVYREQEFGNIRYLVDGEAYRFGEYTALVLGGAYSVDKDYRLKTGKKWFPSEQLPPQDMEYIFQRWKDHSFDFILSHTCPIGWEPRDLFLPFIQQSTVDKTTEEWLEKIRQNTKFTVWCFGHYHKDRIENSQAEQFYQDMDTMEHIYIRHKN